MELAHLLAFNAALLAAIASPGPSLLFLTRTTLISGRAAGIAAGAGLATMAALWTLAALLGLQGLFTVFPWAYALFKTAGAAYLIWIAIQTWRHAKDLVQENGANSSHRRAYLSGFLINLGNPKSVFFSAAVLVVIFPQNLSLADKLLISFNHLVIELTVQPLLAILLSTGLVRQRYLSIKPLIDRATSILLGALGLRLLLSRTG